MIRALRRRGKALSKRWWRSPLNPLSTVVSVRTSEPLVALTFDDGPDPVFTPRLLDILSGHGARATFFMVGSRARAHPELLARVAAQGHAIANHTDSHPSMPTISGRRRRQELRACQAALEPHGTRLFRPPFGHQTWSSRLDALITGYDVVAWGSDVQDWIHQPAETFERRIHETFRPGLILLLHDSICDGTDPAAADRTSLLEGLDGALSQATDFQFVTLPELFARGRPHRARWEWTG